ncbi:hypothetical protein NLX83_14950 [Allokutzneria sp. A3M-2-11 16]|uniref:hypothetical protein n=1 Tax=Allokutzneria sp. A3M-2-11 16 TaxID=2962043 RepID=UPI0020B8C169|nr:hypothetical protein [Allokutzneria sp. A3M-2-11 16]MCP3800562.1 hypothetical protein [Allokutzneria sp. A3M-2-11 16]
MNIWLAIISMFVIPAAVAEVGEVSPWIAGKLVRWGARRIGDPDLSARFAEEWTAGLQSTPGKLTKLLRAASIVATAVPRMHWSVQKGSYLWPFVRTADVLLTIVCPPLARKLRARRFSRFTVHIRRGTRFSTTVGSLSICLKRLDFPQSRWPRRSYTIVEGPLAVTVDHAQRRIILGSSADGTDDVLTPVVGVSLVDVPRPITRPLP